MNLIPPGYEIYIDFHYIPTGRSRFASIKRLNEPSDRFQVASFRRRSIEGAANRSFPYAILRVLLPSIRQRHSMRLYYSVMFSCFLQNWMKCLLDGQIMSTYWETIGELVSAILHHKRRNGGAPGHRAPSWIWTFNNDSGRFMERMRTKVVGALPCAPTLMLQP